MYTVTWVFIIDLFCKNVYTPLYKIKEKKRSSYNSASHYDELLDLLCSGCISACRLAADQFHQKSAPPPPRNFIVYFKIHWTKFRQNAYDGD
jgi:hypothetical protein